MYTTSFAFFEAIWEMVALAMADGYNLYEDSARLTNKPQCVIVHVDVGTQSLASAVHDASTGRCPVLIFAGLSPITIEGEARGSRTEYIHWIQDVPDQKAIIAQYCRYSAEIKTGHNVKQMVNRALSFATSDPKGPVYLVGAREVMEQDLTPYSLDQSFWTPVQPAALPASGVETIAEALCSAKEPLVIVGYTGRNHGSIEPLVELATTVKGVQVLDTGGCDMCFPADHRAWLGMRYGAHDAIKAADVILVIDTDVPWIPTQCKPRSDAKVFHIDVDPLKRLMPVFYLNAVARFCADSKTALEQLNAHIASSTALTSRIDTSRWDKLAEAHGARLADIAALAKPSDDRTFSTSYLISRVKAHVPRNSIWVIEAVTNAPLVHDQVQPTRPGEWINCGGGGLGWSGGASLGIKLASMSSDWPRSSHASSSINGAVSNGQSGGEGEDNKNPFIIQVVGDGTYLFSAPSSVAWVSARYSLPTLTIVLNNVGWQAPRRSTLLVHPDGEASKASLQDLNISFAPSPDYAGIAVAASGGKLWGGRAAEVDELENVLGKAVEMVKAGRGAVVDAQLGGSEGKYTA